MSRYGVTYLIYKVHSSSMYKVIHRLMLYEDYFYHVYSPFDYVYVMNRDDLYNFLLDKGISIVGIERVDVFNYNLFKDLLDLHLNSIWQWSIGYTCIDFVWDFKRNDEYELKNYNDIILLSDLKKIYEVLDDLKISYKFKGNNTVITDYFEIYLSRNHFNFIFKYDNEERTFNRYPLDRYDHVKWQTYIYTKIKELV